MKARLKGLVMLGFLAGMGLLAVEGASAGMVGAPAGNSAADPLNLLDSHRLTVGAEGDWTFDRDLSVSGGINAEENSSKAYRTRLSYHAWGPLEVYALLGAADLELEATSTVNPEKITENFNPGFQYGGGAGVHLQLPPDWWDLRVSIDGQFLQWESDLDHWSGSKTGKFSATSGNVLARAYHAALTLGRSFNLGALSVSEQEWQMTPYIGARWSQFTAQENDLDIDRTARDDLSEAGWRADKHVGVVTGIDVRLGDHWEVTVEGRFVDETAVSASGRFRF